MVNYLMGRYTVGMRQACRCVQMTRSMYYYRSRMDPQTSLRQRMREIAHARVRFGYRRIYILLRREGWDVGKDRFYRVYRGENLGLRRKRPWRHVSAVHRLERRAAARANEVWGMNFVADQLADGRKIRTLTIVDLFTRECLGIEVGFSLRADHVVAAMNRLKYDRGLPERITTDNVLRTEASHFAGDTSLFTMSRDITRQNPATHIPDQQSSAAMRSSLTIMNTRSVYS
jgi:putative transposase